MKDQLISILIVKKLYSILFRVLLIIFSIVILNSNENILNNEIYILIVLIYIVIYSSTFHRDGYFAQLRLINDYLYIVLFLFDKDLSIVSNFIFFSIPIINSANHSGKIINWKFLVFSSITSFLLIVFNPWNDSIFNPIPLIFPICILCAISMSTASRKKQEAKPLMHFANIEDQLNKLIDFPKSYRLYKSLLGQINSMKFLIYEIPNFNHIACFRLNANNRYFLINSSSFIYNYSISSLDILAKLDIYLPEPDFVNDVKININGVDFNKSLAIKIQSKETFVYIITSNSSVISNPQSLYLFEVLSPILERFTRVIEFEQIYKYQNNKYLNDIKEKFTYMRNAEKAMHFIKNKLSPIDNLIEVMKEIMEDEELLFQDTELEKIIKREVKRSENSMNGVIERAKSILDKNQNPFNVTNIENLKAHNVFALVSQLVNEYFVENINIEFSWDIENISNNTIKFNKSGLYIVITDWLSNMNKHGDEFKIFYLEDVANYIVKFQNNYPSSFKEKVQKVVQDFNNNDRKEILRRQSHGIFEIKSNIEEMDLFGEMSLDNDKFIFIIKFKKYGTQSN